MAITPLESARRRALTGLPSQRGAEDAARRRSLAAAAQEPRSDALRWLPITLLGLDLLVATAALVLATAVQLPLARLLLGSTESAVPGVAVAGPALLLVWVSCIAVAGGYESGVLGATATEFNRVLRASIGCAAIVGVGCYLAQFPLSRSWFVLTFGLGTVAVLGVRVLARRWLKHTRAHGRLLHRVLLVGDHAHIESVAEVLRRESWLGYQVVGALAPPYEDEETASGIAILGETDAVSSTAKDVGADVVLLTGGASISPERQRDIAWELEHDHAQLVVAPSVTDVSGERMQVRPVGGLPLIHLEKPRAAKAARRAKRVFDVAGALAVLVLASPVLAYCAARVRLHDGGPVFFRQQRVGRHGSAFACLKFRTMAVDAEARLAAVLAEQGVEHSAFAKLKVDPRITAPGHWLRRFSLDELPQLFNVLRGDMSLVGPRPQTPLEVALYEGPMSRRLHVRPGMTGLWQVSGRSDLTVAESIRLDLYYVDNWSMLQDLAILGRTLGAVAGSRGAY